MPALPASFGGYDMQSFNGMSGVITSELEDGGEWEQQISLHNMPGGGAVISGDPEYYTRLIPAKGSLQQTSIANLEGLIDSFVNAMRGKNKNLDIAYGGDTRRYVCTVNRLSIPRGRRTTSFTPFEVDFLATGFGRDVSTTTLLSSSADTNATRTIPLTVGGSAPEQLLRVAVTVTAATGLENKTVTIKDAASGAGITVTRTWTVGDILEVDVANTTVKVNGAVVDFSGGFPYLPPGNQSLQIINDFTTRTLTTTVDYIRRWL